MQISDEMVEKALEAYHATDDFLVDKIRAALEAALAGHVVVPVEPTPAMLRRGSAMKLDTAMAPGHPGLKENGGKYSRFELMSLETWQEMLRAHGGDDAGK